jgi:hypothetical protein
MVLAFFMGTFVFAEYAAAAKEIGRHGRFIAYDDGTVMDTSTNLMWAARDNGSDINWYNAKSYCESYSGGGYTGWRMPTVDELAGLYGSGNYASVIKLTGDRVWASETRTGYEAVYFQFGYGKPHWTYQGYHIGHRALPVRSGK